MELWRDLEAELELIMEPSTSSAGTVLELKELLGPEHQKAVRGPTVIHSRNSYFYSSQMNWLFEGLNRLKKSKLAGLSVVVKIYVFQWFHKWAGPNGSTAPPKLQPQGPFART